MPNDRASDRAEIAATDLLSRAGITKAPTPLNRIATFLNAEIHQQTFEDMVSGVLLIRGEERHIMVNKAHHPNRQRFTIAHEIGHLVLHHNSGDRLFIDTHLRAYQRRGSASSGAYEEPGSTTTPAEEREANQFASALLMPRAAILLRTDGHEYWDELQISALAAEFGVSEQAMTIRLRQLEVLESIF
jgi:Zn-dependent peptidase ImmA (M78 family)